MKHAHDLCDNNYNILPFFLKIMWKKQQGVFSILLRTQKSASPVLEMGSNERMKHPHCSISIYVDGLFYLFLNLSQLSLLLFPPHTRVMPYVFPTSLSWIYLYHLEQTVKLLKKIGIFCLICIAPIISRKTRQKIQKRKRS